MKEVKFQHEFIINENGYPWSEENCFGTISIEAKPNTSYVEISGNREGLLSLARKLIEVAECSIDGYHKHIDSLEAPNLKIEPKNQSLNIHKTS